MAKTVYLTERLRNEYEKLWATVEVDHKPDAVRAVAKKLLGLRGRYEPVAAKTGVPWFFIAVCHQRESSADFRGVLHNGEHIIGTGRKTKLVPAGRGPFDTWEEAAIDAITLKGLEKIKVWDVPRVLFEIERFNGFGYRLYHPGTLSPYLWSHTNYYADGSWDLDDGGRGKYVADGRFDPNVSDTQIGSIAVLKCLSELDASVRQAVNVTPAKANSTKDVPTENVSTGAAQTNVPTPPVIATSDTSKKGGIIALIGSLLLSFFGWLTDNAGLVALFLGAVACGWAFIFRDKIKAWWDRQ